MIRSSLRRIAISARLVLAAAVAAGLLSAPAGHAAEGTDAERAESELKAIRAEIERVNSQIGRDAAQRDKLTRELRDAEKSVGSARGELERLRAERQQRARRRGSLATERSDREVALRREREALAGQLRAAYLIGREEPLKLVLNQRDPARAGRMFAYYGYFGRARGLEIARIEGHVQALGLLATALEAEERELAALEAKQKSQVSQLERARRERGGVLASLDAETRSRSKQLERLRGQQSGLEKLLRELKRATQRFPVDANDAFAKLRGKLTWPVAGKLVARFGQTRIGGIRWDGVLVATDRGATVRSVYHGRVVYADWLSGLGLLVIVDHGDGYLSLYGHNERLLKGVGERVTAGDPIAAAGDTGGRPRPELYFEIRRSGRPVDPRPWFRSGSPD